ncbi:MAG TPA: nuclear transport factor 2 family protein [Pedobacter sp.]|uniref:nuclear transport factor 2 family protein n=1 Tax=Pedobacter sp. TaxID=1411316 RepID=UPI002C7C4F3E|nr:nuclear transport factor 2 family protein [Pedobacter sp.]HMI04863.1 nuclear transport factor 2 family protein [Pedobacter sp.]
MAGFIGIKDCGNAPRKILLQDFYKAVYRGETGYLMDFLHEQFVWEFPGGTIQTDKKAALAYLSQYYAARMQQLTITKMITHGPEAAVSGTVLTESGLEYHFCDIFTFSSAGSSMIKHVSSFQR